MSSIKFTEEEKMMAVFKRVSFQSKNKTFYMNKSTRERLESIAKSNKISAADAVECMMQRLGL